MFAAFSCLRGQSWDKVPVSPSPMSQVDLSNLKLSIPLLVPHIHTMKEKCENGPDRMFGKTGSVYYACIDGKEVCSLTGRKHPAIPPGMIAEYDAHLAEFRRNHAAWKQGQVAAGRSTGNAALDRQVALQRLAYTTAALKQAQASGQRPNLLEIRKAAEAAYPMTAGPSQTAGASQQTPIAAAPPPQVKPPVADERVLAITTGTPMETVIQQLGSPHGRISGGMERFTYQLASGGQARMDFDEGKVSEIRIAQR